MHLSPDIAALAKAQAALRRPLSLATFIGKKHLIPQGTARMYMCMKNVHPAQRALALRMHGSYQSVG